MIPAIIADFCLMLVMLILGKFYDLEMTPERWVVWKGVGWLVVIISALDYGWQGAGISFLIVAIMHRMAPIGWWIVACVVAVLIC